MPLSNASSAALHRPHQGSGSSGSLPTLSTLRVCRVETLSTPFFGYFEIRISARPSPTIKTVNSSR